MYLVSRTYLAFVTGIRNMFWTMLNGEPYGQNIASLAFLPSLSVEQRDPFSEYSYQIDSPLASYYPVFQCLSME